MLPCLVHVRCGSWLHGDGKVDVDDIDDGIVDLTAVRVLLFCCYCYYDFVFNTHNLFYM